MVIFEKIENEIGAERLKPIKDALPDDISYEDIRIVIIKNRVVCDSFTVANFMWILN
ncbi:helix-turn-helix domain-containing protein [Sporanaerobacter sp.]|uniref:helix-turn-helix domain-containing protein n=1 Tax=Sporanaerobacter sp. TaxID=2010183 RepID=UPI003A0FC218